MFVSDICLTGFLPSTQHPIPCTVGGFCLLLPVSDFEQLPAPVQITELVSSGDSSSSPSESTILLSGGGVYIPLLESGLAWDVFRPREGGGRNIVNCQAPASGSLRFLLLPAWNLLWDGGRRSPLSLRDHGERSPGLQTPPLSPAPAPPLLNDNSDL